MIRVIQGGIQSTIQDTGRFGFGNYGVSQSGPLDDHSYVLSTWLSSDKVDIPTIETFMSGLKLEFEKDTAIGVSGAVHQVFLNNISQNIQRTLLVKAGDQLEIKRIKKGWVSYISIGDGIKVPQFLGSASTSISTKIGGLSGKPLKKGDSLDFYPSAIVNREVPVEMNWPFQDGKINFAKGPEFDLLDERSRSSFLMGKFRVMEESNRIGLRLSGPPIHSRAYDIDSRPVFPGTIQLTEDGPILLLKDCQTTGGYPRIGQVISTHLPLCGQSPPGSLLSFKLVDINQAFNDRKQYQKMMRKLIRP